MLGTREPEVYGSLTLSDIENGLKQSFPEVEFTFFQSNVEGELINEIQRLGASLDALILNPGGYSHTSVAIADAIGSVKTPCVEVHISNIYAREEYRHRSITGSKCKGVITGLGAKGYHLAVQFLLDQ